MDFTSGTSRKWFSAFAWGALAYNIPVILWGAYVRISFSGDGCGDHWPFCNGQVIPHHMAAPMLIEFTHRMMTSVDSFVVIALCVWAFLAFPKRDRIRLYSVLSLVFLFIEALLGAGLVLFRYVAKDQSAGRAWYLSAHLTNTMLLLAALTVTAWLAYQARSDSKAVFGWRDVPSRVAGAMLVTVFVSITGAIAALGDTLFPASSLASGMRQDFASTSSMLLRLRLVHPVIAVAGAAYLVWVAVGILRRKEDEQAGRSAARVLTITLFQLAVGAINITLLAPVWMQLFHLFVADLVWIAVVVLALEESRCHNLGLSGNHLVQKTGENWYAEHSR